MDKFLQQVAKSFYSLLGERVSDLCFVFPNRRSSLFFQKYLGQCASKPIFSSKLLTINDLFLQLSGYTNVNKIEALYILYQHYSAMLSNRESFDDFVYWGDVLLNDFDDIDKYMVKADKLFANIKDLKDLDSGYDFLSPVQLAAIRQFWGNFLIHSKDEDDSKSIDKKRLFGEIWVILYPLYCKFKEDLESKGYAYEGMIYRHVAQTLSCKEDSEAKVAMTQKLSQFGQIVFVGLNALNKCEKVLLKIIRDEFGGDFYWDYFGEMLTDKDNKSSLFMGDNVVDYPSLHPLSAESNPLKVSQKFETISVSSNIGQAKKASVILQQLALREDFVPEETAVVLPDETLLYPMINSIPESIKDINVTMGSPLTNTGVATFMAMIEKLQKNGRIVDGKQCFYHKNVISILGHPFVEAIAGEQAAKLRESIIKGNMIFTSQDIIADLDPLFDLIFKCPSDCEQISDYQLDVIQYVQQFISPLEREAAYQYYKAIVKLRDLHIEMEPVTYFRLLSQLVSVITIPFEGEPLAGLQIMGPLETRALDFKNIIMLSVNEGVFPKKSVSNSYIPYNLRKGFDLPTYEYQDSISAYHFYRSIYRAENVILIYNSTSGGLLSGEVSRFVKQLKYHFEVPIREVVTTYSFSDRPKIEPIEVAKSEEIIKILEDKFINGKYSLSASSLNEYINCPLQFYYDKVEGIAEQEDVLEEADSTLFGTIFHKVMEELYKPYVGSSSKISSDMIDKMIKETQKIDALIVASFKEDANISRIEGKNLITKELIKRYVIRTLEIDKRLILFRLIGTERKVTMRLPLNDKGRSVKLIGYIDRIDSNLDGVCRIVDYKSGTVENKVRYKEVAEVFDSSLTSSRPSISLQLMLYRLLSEDNLLAGENVQYEPCVYALREIFDNSKAPHSFIFSDEDMAEFKSRLISLINEIFNPEIPFRATSDGKYCGYCAYKILCNK